MLVYASWPVMADTGLCLSETVSSRHVRVLNPI